MIRAFFLTLTAWLATTDPASAQVPPNVWVTTAADGPAVPGSLREAITTAAPGQTIRFDPIAFPAAGAAIVVDPAAGALPPLSSPFVSVRGQGRVRLDGTQLPNGVPADGLTISAQAVQVSGLEIHGFPGAGILVDAGFDAEIGRPGSGNVIWGNDGPGVQIGSPTGPIPGTIVGHNDIGVQGGNCVKPPSFALCAGVVLENSADLTVIRSNRISGTLSGGDGVLIQASRTLLSNNRIGTNATGFAPVPNTGNGVLVLGVPGLPVSQVRIYQNLISGNVGNGVLLSVGGDGVELVGNLVGVARDGATALPNQKNGIRVFGSSDHVLGGMGAARRNVVSGNVQAGISIEATVGGLQPRNVRITNAFVGVDRTGSAAVPNGAWGIRTIGAGHHLIGSSAAPNVVSGNRAGGVWLGDPDNVLAGNRIGTDATGSYAIPNGGSGGPVAVKPTFGGVYVTGPRNAVGDGAAGIGNLIAGNVGHGVWIDGRGLAVPIDVRVSSNQVGVDLAGTGALPNEGDGILVEAASGVRIGFAALGVPSNVVGGNDGHGVRILGNPSVAATDCEIVGNYLGLEGLGNGGSGLRIEQRDGDLGVSDHLVTLNDIRGNGEFGVHLTGNSQRTELSQNAITDNGRCAIRREDPANASLTAPRLTRLDPAISTFVVTLPLGVVPADLAAVEVYADDGSEAETFLGNAVQFPTEPLVWDYFPAPGVVLPTETSRIRALVILVDGTTSPLGALCGDGCADVAEAHATCDDFEQCSADYCFEDPGSGAQECRHDARPENFRCDDFDDTTGIVTPAQDGVELRDHCDGTSFACQPGEVIDDILDDCAFATPCWNLAPAVLTCNPEAVCDAICAPDDLDQSKFDDDDLCDACPECAALTDTDGDGISDLWEGRLPLEGMDTDCDGSPDFEIEGASTGTRQIFLHIDYMALDCGADVRDPSDDGPHSHAPDVPRLELIRDRFALEAGIELNYIIDECIPESPLIGFDATPRDRDCTAPDDWVNFYDLKALYFDPRHRGVYHYAVFGHGLVHEELGYEVNQDDGLCGGAGASRAELTGDDLYVNAGFGAATARDPLFDPDMEWATGILMHELGHNLGMAHGGPIDPAGVIPQDGRGYKPNHQSYMGTMYIQSTFREDDGNGCVAGGCAADPPVFNYSREAMPTLDEAALDESAGLESMVLPLYVGLHRCPTPPGDPLDIRNFRVTGVDPVDWDCRGDPGVPAGLIAQDVDQDGVIGPDMVGSFEWVDLNLQFQCGRQGHFVDSEEAPGPETLAKQGLLLSPWDARVDVLPGCAADAVQADGVGSVEVVLFGDPRWAGPDLDPSYTRFMGAPIRALRRMDVDGDHRIDFRMRFDAADMNIGPTATVGYFTARLDDSRPLKADIPIAGAPAWIDGDDDGIGDPCDACPATIAGTVVGDDGCP